MGDLRELTTELVERAKGTAIEALAIDLRDQVDAQLNQADVVLHAVRTVIEPALIAAGATALVVQPAPTGLRSTA